MTVMPADPEEVRKILGKEIEVKPIYSRRCKICTSPNRDYYEKKFMDSNCSPEWTWLSKHAKETFNESISHMGFKRHFDKHFDMPIAKYFEKKVEIEEEVVKNKTETINILKEVRENLTGLKTLIGKVKTIQTATPQTLSAMASIYREHRLTLESCERLTQKLSSTSDISKAEIIREIFYAAQYLCPECKKRFLRDLDDRLQKKTI